MQIVLNLLLGVIILFMVTAPIALVFSKQLEYAMRQKVYLNIKYGCVMAAIAFLFYAKLSNLI